MDCDWQILTRCPQCRTVTVFEPLLDRKPGVDDWAVCDGCEAVCMYTRDERGRELTVRPLTPQEMAEL